MRRHAFARLSQIEVTLFASRWISTNQHDMKAIYKAYLAQNGGFTTIPTFWSPPRPELDFLFPQVLK